MRTVEACLCEHCEKKIYRHKSSVRGHEKRCYWNPENRACASCGYQVDRRCQIIDIDLAAKGALRHDCEFWGAKDNEEMQS